MAARRRLNTSSGIIQREKQNKAGDEEEKVKKRRRILTRANGGPLNGVEVEINLGRVPSSRAREIKTSCTVQAVRQLGWIAVERVEWIRMINRCRFFARIMLRYLPQPERTRELSSDSARRAALCRWGKYGNRMERVGGCNWCKLVNSPGWIDPLSIHLYPSPRWLHYFDGKLSLAKTYRNMYGTKSSELVPSNRSARGNAGWRSGERGEG